jgi:hypothetical protein
MSSGGELIRTIDEPSGDGRALGGGVAAEVAQVDHRGDAEGLTGRRYLNRNHLFHR